MKNYLAAVALAAALAQPASATTFPSLTTIYVASGVLNSNSTPDVGNGTVVHCSNVSGENATIRFLFLNNVGTVAGTYTQSLSHGLTVSVATKSTTTFSELYLGLGPIGQGVVNVESTQSGVFCSAMIVDAATAGASGVALHMVRINGHPGAEE